MPSRKTKFPDNQINETINSDIQSAQWLIENRDAIVEYNDDVTNHGVFSDGLRLF